MNPKISNPLSSMLTNQRNQINKMSELIKYTNALGQGVDYLINEQKKATQEQEITYSKIVKLEKENGEAIDKLYTIIDKLLGQMQEDEK